MAFDISIDKAAPQAPPASRTFADFHADHAITLARVLALACGDQQLADTALEVALTRTSQRWNQLRDHPNMLGWAIEAGIAHADETLRERGPASMNEATGGYVRGLPLVDAIDALPLRQRAALVTAYYLHWSDDTTAAGGRVGPVTTRRTRAVTFLAHHLRTDDDQAVTLVREHFAGSSDIEPDVPAVASIRRTARRQTFRNRGLATIAVLLVIVSGATLVQVARQNTTPQGLGPEPISPPTNSSDWLPPIGDGQGGFVALNTSGASRFASSADGSTWFDETTWNSRAVDLRTEVTGFHYTGGRFFSTIEAVPAVRGAVPPRLATSNDLFDWRVTELDIPIAQPVEGVRSRAGVVNIAAAGSDVLLAVDITESIDYQALGLLRQDVCVEATLETQRALYLCTGEVITIDLAEDQAVTPTRYLLSQRAGEFTPVDLPEGVDARSLVSFGTGFAVSHSLTGRLWLSDDGRSWQQGATAGAQDRFVLLEGNNRGELLVVQPSDQGWGTALLDVEADLVSVSSIDLNLDPTLVWNKPELAAGPAGWAVFVTTSRPWERGDAIRGWAIDVGDFTVSRQPDSPIITAQSRESAITYRVSESSDAVEILADGSVNLLLPMSADVDSELVTLRVSADEIERSRAAADSDEVKAQVFFSVDGTSWRSIWQSSQDTWFGSVAVGDDHVLISGTALTGAPIAVPLE